MELQRDCSSAGKCFLHIIRDCIAVLRGLVPWLVHTLGGLLLTHCGAFAWLILLQTASYVALFMLPLGDAVTIKLIGPPMTATFACLLLKEPMG